MTHRAPALDAHDLPLPATPLIGRQRELAEARTLLLADHVRLMTLVGAAGVGKTSLALGLAAEVVGAFPDGVWFIDLAAQHDPETVPSAIAQVLGIGGDTSVNVLPQLDEDTVALLRRNLRSRRVLLVLDNFEQVLPAAPIVAELATAGPASKILITSRERLRLRTEHVYPVSPLAVPDHERLPPLDELAEVPAVALFLRRARAAKPDLALTAGNASAVAEICRRLDGLPLAIELAAAHANVLTPAMLLARLEPRLPLLRWPAQDMPTRHRTLSAAIAWSYDLLTHEERALFRRLGAFVGFTLDAAGWVAHEGDRVTRSPSSGTLDLVSSLVDKSLVLVAEPVGKEPRFGMLETLRAFALDRLHAGGELEAAQRDHAAYFSALAERAQPELTGAAQAFWMTRLEREHANLRATLDWLGERGTGEEELRLAVALRRFWRSRGYPGEGQRRLEGALSRTPTAAPALRARALDGAGLFLHLLGQSERAAARYEEALAIARSINDASLVAQVLVNLGVLATHRKDDARAQALLEESLAMSRQLGEHWTMAVTLYKLGVLAQLQNSQGRAATLLRESLNLFQGLDDERSVAVVLPTLARSLVAENGRMTENPLTLVAAGLALCRDLQDRYATLNAVELTAEVTVGRVAPDYTARLLGAADSLREATGIARNRNTDEGYARTAAAARAALDEQTFDEAWGGARAMSLDAVIDAALAALREAREPARPLRARAQQTHSIRSLTRREREVLGMLANGLSNRDIARELSISERTARFHVTSILGKLGVRTRGQAVAVAIRQNLI